MIQNQNFLTRLVRFIYTQVLHQNLSDTLYITHHTHARARAQQTHVYTDIYLYNFGLIYMHI